MLARLTTVLLATSALVAGLSTSAGAATITEFPLPANARPYYMVASPSGTFWYTDLANGVVGGVNSEGTSIASLKDVVPAGDIAIDAKGVIYWTGQTKGGTIARRQLNGSVTTDSFGNVREAFAIGITAGGGERLGGQDLMDPDYMICEVGKGGSTCSTIYETEITDLAPGPGGVLWAMEPYSDLVHRLASPGEISSALAVNLPPGTVGKRAVLGPDGNLWVLGEGSSEAQNRLVRIGFDGQQTSFLIPAGRQPQDITVGADGALWFSEFATGSIGRMTTAGEYSSCLLPSAASVPHPYGIATGTDGNIWFTEREGHKIGRLSGNCVPVVPPVTGGGNTTPVTKPTVGTKPAPNVPLLSKLTIAPAAFRAASAGATVAKGKGGAGATISFSLDAAADVAFGVERKASGRRVGGKCQAPSGSNRGKPKCPRFVPVGSSFASPGKAGANSLAFSGRVGGKSLVPGSYRLVATARNGGGVSVPVAKGFAILAAKRPG